VNEIPLFDLALLSLCKCHGAFPTQNDVNFLGLMRAGWQRRVRRMQKNTRARSFEGAFGFTGCTMRTPMPSQPDTERHAVLRCHDVGIYGCDGLGSLARSL